MDPVQADRENGVPVRAWIARWRTSHAEGELSPDLAARLKAIPGWSWTSLATVAEVGMREDVTVRNGRE